MVSRIGLNSVWTPALVGMAASLGPSTDLVFDRLYVFCCFPMEGFPIDGKPTRKGCVIWVVHGAALGLRASLFSLSLRIKRGMVSVTVLFGHLVVWYVCVCVRVRLFPTGYI